MRNVFKGKNLTHLLYGILMLLPFCSILARVIYVQSNQNAKDSYYGSTINQSEVVSVDFDNLSVGYTYSYKTSTNLSYLYQSEVSFNVSNFTRTYPAMSVANQNRVNRIIFRSQNDKTYVFFYDNNTYVSDSNLGSTFIEFSFVYTGGKSGSLLSNYSYFTTTIYNVSSYLDNVFDYSISNFIEDNNYNIDFFGWFNNLFLNQSGKNLLYLNFVNWYLNYALLVSAGYILFLLFLWFINFARKLLEGGNSFGHGGF